ncbi:hypothetical protein CKO37_01685 [Rubrivivax gelatinosus]|nr:hypothetical protein [Rubrivivax gelatinosus]
MEFTYVSGHGRASVRRLTAWVETGHYIQGFDPEANQVLSFRKDRVVEYLRGREYLREPDAPPPPVVRRETPPGARPAILFTGFAAVQRAHLERVAADAGLRVVKSVTRDLMFLVAGPNAGPTKVEGARELGSYIVSEPEFFELAQTGVLPDSAAEAGTATDC